MTYPYGKKPGRGSKRVVPLDKAKEIALQRDQLAEEVEKLQREKEQLAEAKRAAEADNEELEQRFEEAKKVAQQLRGKLKDAIENGEGSGGSRDPRESDLVARLKQRVEGLSADLERVRKRSDESSETAKREERMRLLSNLSDVLDSVERGLSMASEGGEREGLEAIYSQFKNFLRREGASLTGEVGASMDPNIHEAISMIEEPRAESGEIVEVARHGITLEDGTVVLPARVVVAK